VNVSTHSIDLPLHTPHTTKIDTNGILYFIGTGGGTRPWSNPCESRLVVVTSSPLMRDSTPCSAVVGREVVRCVTLAEPNAFFAVDLVNKWVVPSHYTLRFAGVATHIHA
jgi:hypothetical protein